MSAPVARTLSGSIALTVAAVPTGMNAGVRMSPRGVRIVPVRASPSVACRSKETRVGMPPCALWIGERKGRGGLGRASTFLLFPDEDKIDRHPGLGCPILPMRHSARRLPVRAGRDGLPCTADRDQPGGGCPMDCRRTRLCSRQPDWSRTGAIGVPPGRTHATLLHRLSDAVNTC